ncbi:hypothetical protein SCHPADRAFT_573956 [Schizopora paradoxa]|uniref:25S rRNA (uridine-N(3))-methyltransferase BMT5-like domain-containing protein n=1 Tax=Schizopora paradoxa TaxID=27342 RepID=A0A0H2RCM6_9AGAM|nr:hypothetical protein SCHPADRAFT_573956 [Schizopora paradoxa]
MAKKSLKAALTSHQGRMKKNAQAKEAAQSKEKLDKTKTSSKAKGKAKAGAPRTRKSIVPFYTTDRILLIGEGNFSFALALFKHPALEFLPGENVTATAYDSEEECYEKYPDAKEIVQKLRELKAEVLFRLDATKLESYKALKGRRWNKVVWNFPHAGKGITDQDRNILSNQLLLLGFLRSVGGFLVQGPIPKLAGSKSRKGKDNASESEDEPQSDYDDMFDDEMAVERSSSQRSKSSSRGTVLVTLRNVPPYTEWDLPKLAKKPPPPAVQSSNTPNPTYIQLRSFAFRRTDWPGYEHRMTKGERVHGAGTTGVGGEDRTWEFCLKDA